MKVKSVVKIMNFHSLLRVNSARRKADKLNKYEIELSNMIGTILNNRNLLLDKKVLVPPKNKKNLVIYIGNDYGFCANFNTLINNAILADKESDKIIIGKKLTTNTENIIKYLDKENYYQDSVEINKYILDSLINFKYTEIKVIYNHYYNVNNLSLVEKTIFPLASNEKNKNKDYYIDDFIIEGNINAILINLVSLYISYEIQIAESSSWAAENVMRQMVTKESLDKIERIETEKKNLERKNKKNIAFKKIIENSNYILKREEK